MSPITNWIVGALWIGVWSLDWCRPLAWKDHGSEQNFDRLYASQNDIHKIVASVELYQPERAEKTQ